MLVQAIAESKVGAPASAGTAKAGAEPNGVPAAPATAATTTAVTAPDAPAVNPARSGVAPATAASRERVSTPAAAPTAAHEPSTNFYPGADGRV